jgi:hypothetical protein
VGEKSCVANGDGCAVHSDSTRGLATDTIGVFANKGEVVVDSDVVKGLCSNLLPSVGLDANNPPSLGRSAVDGVCSADRAAANKDDFGPSFDVSLLDNLPLDPSSLPPSNLGVSAEEEKEKEGRAYPLVCPVWLPSRARHLRV